MKVHSKSGLSLSRDFLRAMHVRKVSARMKNKKEVMYGKSCDNANLKLAELLRFRSPFHSLESRFR